MTAPNVPSVSRVPARRFGDRPAMPEPSQFPGNVLAVLFLGMVLGWKRLKKLLGKISLGKF